MDQPQVDLNAELEAARRAVQEGRQAAAVTHLANIVPQVCSHPAVLAVLDDLVTKAVDPLQLVPSGPATYGPAAIHAYALGKVGRASEAYGILRQLVPANPGNGAIDWALPWLDGGALSDAQRAEAVSLFLVSAHRRGLSTRQRLNQDEIALVRRWLPHIREVMADRPFTDPLYSMFVPLLRKIGQQEEALAIVRARFEEAPSYQSAVSLAATLRDNRDFDGWYEASLQCLKFQPDDIATRLDLGDCFWEEQGKLEQAEQWYADALRLEPEQPWAAPSLLAVHYLRTRDPQWRDQLEDYAAGHRDNQRAQVALGRLTPFFADFLHPADACVNIMNEMADKIQSTGPGEPSGRISVTTTGLEYPSCRQSIDRQLELWGGKIQLSREIRGMQTPDPRQPRVPVRHRLWEYDGLTPQPVVAAPPAAVAELVGAIAQTKYDLGDWCGYAAHVAGRLGPANLPGLLGVMVHPPAPATGWRMWDWTSRVQVAAALVIGHLGTDWEGSLRREVLIDLANGPIDWTTVAAVVALSAAALEQPAIAPEVSRLFTDLYADLPRPGADWYENVILNCHLRLPGLSATERQTLRDIRSAFEARCRSRSTDAEMAAQVFLARPVPTGMDDFKIARLVIETFAARLMRDHPGFPTALQSSLMFTEALLPGAEGEALEYLTEQARVLRLIQQETAAAGQTEDAPGP